MFICDHTKREIAFFDGKEVKKLTADFDFLLSKIQRKYKKKENMFIGKGSLQMIKNQPSFFFSFLHSQRFEVGADMVEKLWIKQLLNYFYGYTMAEVDQIENLGVVEIYGDKDDKKVVQVLDSEKILIEKSFFVDWCFDETEQLHVAYARFPFVWGNYTKNAHIDNSSIGVDTDKNRAYQKALSEAIERVSASYSDLTSKLFSSLDSSNQNLLLTYQKYEKSDTILGTDYWTLDKRKSCFLPEYITYYPTIWYYAYDSNSNGMATHNSLQEAQQSALLELIERDAFLFSWLTKSHRVKKIQHEVLDALGIKINESDFSFYFFMLDSFVPVPTVLMIMEKGGKSCISLATDFQLKKALIKAYQEGINSKPLFEKPASSCYEGVMGHIFYYLDPQNKDKLNRMHQTEELKLQDMDYFIATFDELVVRFESQQIELYFYEYTNKLNQLFDRKTVRCYSSAFLPIYFWKTIPQYVRSHPKLKGIVLNGDMHPLG